MAIISYVVLCRIVSIEMLAPAFTFAPASHFTDSAQPWTAEQLENLLHVPELEDLESVEAWM